MYTAFDSDVTDDLFYESVSLQNRSSWDGSYEFDLFESIDRDESLDALKDPSAIGPWETAPGVTPPRVAQVEVKTVKSARGDTSRGSRQEALAQLREQRDVLGLQGSAGIALVTPDGSVEYTVFDPTLRRVLYRRVIGSVANLTPQNAEEKVRRLLNRKVGRQTGQRFPIQKRRRKDRSQTNKTSTDQGPDLLPVENHNQDVLRSIFQEYQSRSRAVRQSQQQSPQRCLVQRPQSSLPQSSRSPNLRQQPTRLQSAQRMQPRSQQAHPPRRPPQRTQRPQAVRLVQMRSHRASPQSTQRTQRSERNRFDAFAKFF